ncbi:MAG TPA: hypothetical protein VGM37_18425 [Armatimonadota bacterium]
MGGYESPETEAILRAALAEPAAPGEDDSYRRLMVVVADDLRLRQPAPQRANWAWIPALSVTAATAVLAVFAYVAGVDHGIAIADRNNKPIVAVNPQPTVPVPPSRYTPVYPLPRPAAPQPRTGTPARLNPSPGEPVPATEFIGSMTSDTLSRDQRDMLAIFVKQYEAREWQSAVNSLKRLAETDPDGDLAANALHGAAEIQRTQLSDAAGAGALYQREIDTLDALLANATEKERKAALQTQRDAAAQALASLPAPPQP